MKKIIERHTFLSLILIGLPSVYYLLRSGFYEPHDLHHISDIYQMARAIVAGQFPPRWGPDFLYGFGYPLFNFYYLSPFYVGAFIFLITNSLQFSFEAVFIISVFISVWGMYMFLREFVGRWAAFAGSVLFLYTPYRAVQIYVRGAMGEAFALALLPLVAWLFVRLGKNKNRKNLIISSLVLSIFILSHNYFWFLTLPWVFLFVLFLFWKDIKRVLPAYLKATLLSVGLTAYWWIPAIVEKPLVTSKTPFPLLDHFPFIKQLIVPSWGYGSSVWGPGDHISFQIGLINLIAIVALIIVIGFEKGIRKNKKLKTLTVWSIAGFILSVTFMNIRTYPVWKLLPFHDFIQFPWRLLTLTTFFSSIIASVLVELFNKNKNYMGWFIVLGSIILTLSYFKPSEVFHKSDDDYLRRFFANRSINGSTGTVSEEYLNYSEDYLLLPGWVKEKPDYLPSRKFESKNLNVVNIRQLSPTSYSVNTSGDGEGELEANILYYPGWTAYLDGLVVDTYMKDPYGKLAMRIPSGEHEIKVVWKENGNKMIADLISLGSLACAIYLFLDLGSKKNGKKEK